MFIILFCLDESFWSSVFSLKYILHTVFMSVIMLRTNNFVGMLNLSLKRLTDDPDQGNEAVQTFSIP